MRHAFKLGLTMTLLLFICPMAYADSASAQVPQRTNDPLMQRALRSRDAGVSRYIRDYARTHGGPSAYRDEGFRSTLIIKLDALDPFTEAGAAGDCDCDEPPIMSAVPRRGVNLTESEVRKLRQILAEKDTDPADDDLERISRRRREPSPERSGRDQDFAPENSGFAMNSQNGGMSNILGYLMSMLASSSMNGNSMFGGNQMYGGNQMFGGNQIYGNNQMFGNNGSPFSQSPLMQNNQFMYGNGQNGWNQGQRSLPYAYQAPNSQNYGYNGSAWNLGASGSYGGLQFSSNIYNTYTPQYQYAQYSYGAGISSKPAVYRAPR